MTPDQIQKIYAHAKKRWGPQDGEDKAHDAWVKALESWDPARGDLYPRVMFHVYKTGRAPPHKYVYEVPDLGREYEPDMDQGLISDMAYEFGTGLPDPERLIWFLHLMTPDPVSERTGKQTRGRFKILAEASGLDQVLVARTVRGLEAQFVRETREALCL